MEGRKVLYVSLEMSEDKIAQRFDSVMTLLTRRIFLQNKRFSRSVGSVSRKTSLEVN
jgi:hypothetical protein